MKTEEYCLWGEGPGRGGEALDGSTYIIKGMLSPCCLRTDQPQEEQALPGPRTITSFKISKDHNTQNIKKINTQYIQEHTSAKEMGISTVWYPRSWALDSDGLTQMAAYCLWDVGKLLHLSANHLPPHNEAKPVRVVCRVVCRITWANVYKALSLTPVPHRQQFFLKKMKKLIVLKGKLEFMQKFKGRTEPGTRGKK